jgi:hypothetical protein
MNNTQVKRVEYVEVFIPTGSTKQVIYFPDLPNLRTAKTNFVSVYDVNLLPVSFAGNTVQGLTEVKNSITTLYFDGGDFIQIPTIAFYNFGISSNVYQYPLDFAKQRIVWAKCYITLTNTAGIAGYANKSFIYSVGYEY